MRGEKAEGRQCAQAGAARRVRRRTGKYGTPNQKTHTYPEFQEEERQSHKPKRHMMEVVSVTLDMWRKETLSPPRERTEANCSAGAVCSWSTISTATS